MPLGANLYVAGWAHFRAGQFRRAIERLEKANSADPGWPGRGIPYPLLAMANHRVGRGEDARQALAATDQMIDAWSEEIVQGPVGAMPIPWFDWIECRVHHREAKILITRFAPPDDPRLLEVEKRALAAIRNDEATVSPGAARHHMPAHRGSAPQFENQSCILGPELSWFSHSS